MGKATPANLKGSVGGKAEQKRGLRFAFPFATTEPMTRLSWNEIRVRAAAFAAEWRDATYEKGQTQSFYNDFFHIFGVKRSSVARYEEHVKKAGQSFGLHRLVLARCPPG